MSSGSGPDPLHECRRNFVARDDHSLHPLVSQQRRSATSNLAAASTTYATIEAARLAGAALLRHERVQRVVIARDEVPPAFVEWIER